jgi:hypothetical protein
MTSLEMCLPWAAAFSGNAWAILMLLGLLFVIAAVGLLTGWYGRVIWNPLALSDRTSGYVFGALGLALLIIGFVYALA